MNRFLSWYVRSSSTAYTFKPELVLVEAIRLTITSELVRGLPFQLILINENSLCSIAFHLSSRLMIRTQTSTDNTDLLSKSRVDVHMSRHGSILVPGGKWQTEISRPVSSASRWRSFFQSFSRYPFDPPESAVIINRVDFA